LKSARAQAVRRRTACARAQFSGCSSTTNAHSETGQMAVSCQNLALGALSSRSAPSVLVGELFKKSGLFLNTGVCGTKMEEVTGERRQVLDEQLRDLCC
jgi:hypothetical protein